MLETQIKPDYSKEVAQFLANGGQIQQAVNTNKAEWNFPISGTGLKQNIPLRKRAEQLGLKTYAPFEACHKCGTSERSTKTNACIVCDRNRSRVKNGLKLKNLQGVGVYLLEKNETVEFTSNGQKYVLKVEVA